MMNSIFTSFDFHISNKYLFLLAPMFIYITTLSFTNKVWAMSTRSSLSNTIINLSLSLNSTTMNKYNQGSTFMLITLFMILIYQNISGLIPWGATSTAHLMMTLSIASPMWLSMPFLSYLQKPKMANTHYLPESTTMSISMFLATVESISSLIRPITLAFRLSANISAGHVIMSMMGTIMTFTMMWTLTKMSTMLLFIGGFYMTFELMISSIQAFVMTLLLIMYSNDYLISRPTLTIK